MTSVYRPERGGRRFRRIRRWAAAVLACVLTCALSATAASPAAAAGTFVPISGSGSSWSYTALHTWQGNVAQYGMRIDYTPSGSTTGRMQFKQGTVDWAASDIPYGVKDGTNLDPPPTSRGYAYMPDTAGGTVFMYNLKIGTRRVTNLRLSGSTVAAIFTGKITKWNDPAIAADNPGLTLPAIKVVPVVRSDGSGSTAQLTQWMIATQGSYWTAYCAKVGRNPCTQTSAYPILPNSAMKGQPLDTGVSGYVSQEQANGAIGYVEYSYAILTGFPVAKVLNSAGYYTEPTAGHVAVALLKAKINMDASNPATYLTQDLSKVYTNPDPRAYELSSYSYMVLPTSSQFGFTANKGYTLGEFGKYLLCQGQRQVNVLGYSALPINLVEAGFAQLQKIPGANVPTATSAIIKSCNNPTFSSDGTNTLAKNDPQPQSCDRKGPTQCVTGTGGAKAPTPVKPGTQGGTTSGAGVPNSAGSGPLPPGVTPSASATSVTCDPDSGVCTPVAAAGADADQDQAADAVPVATSTQLAGGLRVTLMTLAAVLLVGLCLAPPLISQAMRRRRERRYPFGGMR